MRTNLAHLLQGSAELRPSHPAITHQDRTVSYAELWAVVARRAAGLRRIGLATQDRVAIYLDKRIETVEAIFAAAASGGVLVPVNPVLKPAQVAHILVDSEASVLVTSLDRWALMAEHVAQLTALRTVVIVGSPTHAPIDGVCHRWDDLDATPLELDRIEQRVARSVDLDLAAIFYTSGSTGKPKGVVLSHRNLIVGAESVSSYLRNDDADVILSALPLSFDAGFSQLSTAFAVGAHVILMNYLRPGEVVKLCARHRVTGLTGVPPLWIQLAALDWPAEVGDRLRYFANTGGRMPKATLDRLRSIFSHADPYLM